MNKEIAPLRVRLTTEDIYDDGKFVTRRYCVNVLINGSREYDIDLNTLDELETLAKLLTDFAVRERKQG
jgi:hypothetical protein